MITAYKKLNGKSASDKRVNIDLWLNDYRNI